MAAVPLVALAAILFSGCASLRDTRFSRIVPLPAPEPVRVAVLPPRIPDALRPGQLPPEGEWYERLAAGRGLVVTSATPERDLTLALVGNLSLGNAFTRVFPAADAAEAAHLGADRVLQVTVHDYRTILRGANSRYSLVVLLGPLFPQYWVRWLTLEASLDWEVELRRVDDGTRTFARRLERHYYRTVRYALGAHLTDKMLAFLRGPASTEFIGELFLLDMAELPDDPDGDAEPAPEPPAAAPALAPPTTTPAPAPAPAEPPAAG